MAQLFDSLVMFLFQEICIPYKQLFFKIVIAMNRYSKNIVITIQVIISKINIFPNIQTFYMHTKL